jgi:hypothetical protein
MIRENSVSFPVATSIWSKELITLLVITFHKHLSRPRKLALALFSVHLLHPYHTDFFMWRHYITISWSANKKFEGIYHEYHEEWNMYWSWCVDQFSFSNPQRWGPDNQIAHHEHFLCPRLTFNIIFSHFNHLLFITFSLYTAISCW